MLFEPIGCSSIELELAAAATDSSSGNSRGECRVEELPEGARRGGGGSRGICC